MDTVLSFQQLGTKRVAVVADVGPHLTSEADALNLIGACFGEEVDYVVIPKARLASDFFVLSNKMLGSVVQKFVNYRLGLALVGNFDKDVADSTALRDLIHESNKGKHLVFASSLQRLGEMIA